MGPKLRIVAALLWLLTPLTAGAQHWTFRDYSAVDGLTNQNILALHQDRQGFLWVSTEGGLFRYDGDRFRAFSVGGPGKATTVSSLYTSADGQLWAGSMRGLFRLSGDRFDAVPGFAGAELASNQAIAGDSSHLYVASAAGLWSFPLSGRVRPSHLTSIAASSVFVARDQTVWFGCGAALCYLRDSHVAQWEGRHGSPQGPWHSIVENSEGQLWLRSPDRVMVLQRSAGAFREMAKLATTHRAILVPGPNGEVFVPHSAGLAVCFPHGCQNYGVESGLKHAAVFAVQQDREGSFWLGYSGHGLSRWLGREEWQSFGELEGLTDTQIWRIARTPDGRLWVGTNSGLFQATETNGRWTFRHSGVLRDWTVYGLVADPAGSLWLGTFQPGLHGLVNYNPTTGRSTIYPLPQSWAQSGINKITRDSTGTIWVATPLGVLRLRPGAKKLETVDLPLSGASVYDIKAGPNALYVGGRRGLYMERNGVKRFLSEANGLKDNAIQSIAVGPAGEVWIAYYEPLGLTRIDWNGGHIRMRHFSDAEGLPSSVVYSQFFDARGRHWIGTDSGVAVFEGQQWIRYDSLDGLVWNDTNAGAYLIDSDSSVWLGTSAGLSRFLPADRAEPPLPQALITMVTRNDALVRGKTFDAGTHSVALHYTVLSYRRENPMFRYRLGKNASWIQTRAREVHFAELPPGDYHFEVQGEVAPGVWSYPAAQDFCIQPPWFRAEPFVVGAPSLLVILIWFGWRRRERLQQKIRADLEAAVTERTRSLAAATARAEQESRFKGEFLANMSHEMRTPLNGVLGITKLALEVSHEPEVIRHLKTVQFSANVLLTLINDVLDLAKMEAGMVKIVPVAFSPRLLGEEVRMMLDAEAKNKGLRLELFVAGTVPEWIWADDARLRQVLVNLVGNGLKFTPKGSVTVSLNHDGSHLHCAVSDTGIGIAESEQGLIFEVFRQADSSTSRRYGGSGLGLAICRNLVESMGGSIGVESVAGAGSRFYFDIEAPEAAAPAAPLASAAVVEAPVRPLRVLVAEDNRVNQYLLTALLRKWGHGSVIANNGLEALDASQKERFDLILMDIQMPEMDGLQAVRLLRERESLTGKRVPVIAVTARAMPGDRAEILSAGMDDYLEKPIQTEHLQAILRKFAPAGDARHPVTAEVGAAELAG